MPKAKKKSVSILTIITFKGYTKKIIRIDFYSISNIRYLTSKKFHPTSSIALQFFFETL